jgi:uncharacterized membrane protein
MSYEVLLAIHIGSVILLLGVGGGSAFYKFMADRSNNLEVILHTNKTVVLVDWLFTTPSVILQPITGIMLANLMRMPLTTPWILASIILYALSIILWIVAVYLQIKMKIMAIQAKKEKLSLDDTYAIYVKWWIILGFLSFFSMVSIFILMIFKP